MSELELQQLEQQQQHNLHPVCKHKKAKRNDYRFSENIIITKVILALVLAKLCVLWTRHLMAPTIEAQFELHSSTIREPKMAEPGAADFRWASWLGETPSAAQVYAESSSELPVGETLDDDDDEDEELDASATNEYPDSDTENTDESYEEPEDGQESSRLERWLASEQPRRAAPRLRRQADDEMGPQVSNDELARPLAASHSADEMDASFKVDDGDEDAWVHDGVDDIHIDPETRRAASELSSEPNQEASLDAEYDAQPNQQPEAQAVDEEASKAVQRFAIAPETLPVGGQLSALPAAEASSADISGQSKYVPASQLSFEQLLRALGPNLTQR